MSSRRLRSPTYHGPDRRAGQRQAEHQAREEAHRGASQKAGRYREALPVEPERSVQVPYNHRHVLEE